MSRAGAVAEVGLGLVVVAWAGLVLAGGAAPAPPPPPVPRPRPPVAVPLRWTVASAARLLDAPAEPPLLPAWLWHRRPLVIPILPAIEASLRPVHEPALVELGEDEPGRLGLRISPSPEDRLVVVVRREVWRWNEEDRRPTHERVAELAPTVTEWTDEHLTWPGTYAYEVVSLAQVDDADPVVMKHHLTLPEAEARRESSVAARALKREVWVSATLVHAPSAAGEPARVDLCVHRWDRAARAFRERRLLAVAVGDPIGRARPGQDPLFETGALLRAVDATPGSESVTIRWPDGRDETVRVGAGS